MTEYVYIVVYVCVQSTGPFIQSSKYLENSRPEPSVLSSNDVTETCRLTSPKPSAPKRGNFRGVIWKHTVLSDNWYRP